MTTSEIVKFGKEIAKTYTRERVLNEHGKLDEASYVNYFLVIAFNKGASIEDARKIAYFLLGYLRLEKSDFENENEN